MGHAIHRIPYIHDILYISLLGAFAVLDIVYLSNVIPESNKALFLKRMP